MRIDRKRLTVRLIALALIVTVLASGFIAYAEPALRAPSYPGRTWRYNEETGYSAVIVDDADLLTDREEADLIGEMYPLTEYANIAVYTVDTKTSQKDYERARAKREELFGRKADAAIFTVDMYLRRIVIQRKGNMEKYFNNSRANNITNNVSSAATRGDYFTVCKTAMQQMLAVIQDRAVPKPMQYLSNGVISLMLGCLTAFIVAVLTSSTQRKRKEKKKAQTLSVRTEEQLGFTLSGHRLARQRIVSNSSSSSDRSSCGGSSCGGSSSSCGGSSCGGSSF